MLRVNGHSRDAGDRMVSSLDLHLLVRTTCVWGEGRNFVRTMAGLADRGVCPSVVDDQVGRPTAADDLAAAVAHLVQRGASGTYNATGGGEPASWADVAEVVFAARGRDPGDVRRVSTAEYTAGKPGLALRPRNSVLDLARLEATSFRPRDWRAALDGHLAASAV